MEFVHPNEVIAQEMIRSISHHIEAGTMLEVSVEEILSQYESWFAAIGKDQKLNGFFCIRRPHPDFAEMGSVCSLSGVGHKLIHKFESQRRLEGQANGCAITKKSPEFFVTQTKGKVLKTFPDWYQKTTDDKHFVCWI